MKNRLALISGMFLLSGATGLLYEVAFSKVLATIFGATAYAVSTVLSAFMAGLALGSYVGGRLSPRLTRPLLAYGVAEILVGLICAGTPSVFDALLNLYLRFSATGQSLGSLTLIRAALTFIVILIPTCAMGATLPFLARVVRRIGDGERHLPRLYATNTLGGALGSLLSAYWILPTLGIRGTMQAAALVNVAIGLLAMGLGRTDPPEIAPKPEPAMASDKARAPSSSSLAPSLFAFAFASGFLVFATEVVETHLLALLIGNSAYAFGLMLAVFLLCLGLGAARATALIKGGDAEQALSKGLVYTSVGLAASLALWDRLPGFFAAAGKVVESWAGREICRALAALVILAIPTLLMGTSFPLLLSRVAKRPTVSSDVATLTVWNTLGTIAGSIATGYAILPRLGSQRTLILIAIAFAIFGAVAAKPTPSRRRIWAFAAAGALIAVLVPTWDLARLTNGANVYFTYGPPPDDIVFVREDVHGGVTTVARRGDLHTLYTNGKFQGDDGKEMSAQRRFAHFPSLFLKQEKRALVIGLGTGVTVGAVAAYPFESIDVAEISPAIVEASELYYGAPSRFAMKDPRVTLHLNDGRNVILTAREPYDLITIELTSVWFAGASNLYSTDFYALAKAHLSEGGVLQQWVQLHHLRRRELAVIIRTLRSQFRHVALFEGGSQGILVASDEPLVASEARLARLEGLPAIAETLDGKSLRSLLDELLLSDADLDPIVAEADLLSTDDNLYLEYATPKGNILNYDQSLGEMMAYLNSLKTEGTALRHLGP